MRPIILSLLICLSVSGAAVKQSLLDMEGGVNGQVVTTIALSNSLHGEWATFALQNINSTTFTNGVSQHALWGVAHLASGGDVDGNGTLGLSIVEDGTDASKLVIYPYGLDNSVAANVPTNPVTSASCWFKTDMQPISGGQHDCFILKATNDFVNFYVITSNNKLTCGIESGSWEDNTQDVPITTNVWYRMCLQIIDSTSISANLYDAEMNLISTWRHAATGTGGGYYVLPHFQAQLYNGTTGFHVWFDSITWDFVNGTFPLLPDTTSPKKVYSPSLLGQDLTNSCDYAAQFDSIILPVGTNVLTNANFGTSYKSVNIYGAGGGYTGSQGPNFPSIGYGNTSSRTVLSNAINATTPTLQCFVDSTNWLNISNLDLATYYPNANGQVQVVCNNPRPRSVFRMTGCKLYLSPTWGATNAYNGFDSGAAYGLIDNCYFRSTNVDTGSGHAILFDANGNGNTATNWHIAQSYGDTNTLVVETCTLDFEGTDDSAFDTHGAAKLCVRFNTFTNTWGGTHGADSDPRAPRLWEIYWNQHYSRANARGAYTATRCLHIRGGTGVIWANKYDAAWNGLHIVDFRQFRATAGGCAANGCYSSQAWFLPAGGLQGDMNGSQIVDGNQAGTGWPGLDQIGRGSFTVNPPVWTSTFTVGNYEQSEPAYLWTNNVNGNLSPTFSATGYGGEDISATIIVNGRDANNNTAKPGYTALPYPHPLIGGGVSYWPVSAPAANAGMGTVGAGGAIGAGGRVGL